MSDASSSTRPPILQRTFLGHPVGLYVLFFTEMWERFSYYGMRALLILYMVNYFKWAQKDASTIYKVYTSFVYVTPIIGGFLADRYLGNRRAVVIGAALMAIGHFLMAFEEFPVFLSALIFLILGNGMFKPNMSTQVGRLYPANDGRRDAAYTIFYMGINLGAFLSPLVCGWLADNTVGGYHSGFTMAGIGMVLGLIIYLAGQPLIREIDPHTTLDETPTDLEGSTAPPEAQSHAITAGIHHVRPGSPAPDVGRAPSQGIVAGTPPQSSTGTMGLAPDPDAPLTEAQAERVPSALGVFSNLLPLALYALTLVLLAAAPVYYFSKPQAERVSAQWDAIMLAIGGVSLGLIAFVCGKVHNGVRDRVLAILVLGVFVMFFWGAFEQAGNVLNLWADKNTNRYLWQPMQPLPEYPEVLEAPRKEGQEVEPPDRSIFNRFATMFRMKPARDTTPRTWGQYFEGFFNPITTTSFQSINALAIFVLAPAFAWFWIWLNKKDMQPSIPMKMFFGLVFMSLSVAVMIQAARQEDKQTNVRFTGKLPSGIARDESGRLGVEDKNAHFEPFHAGRLTRADSELRVRGVLPDTERDRIVELTAPEDFKKAVEKLAEKSKQIDDKTKSVSATLDRVPPGFDMRFAGLKKTEASWDPQTKTLTVYQPLKEREIKGLLVAAGEPTFRKAITDLYVASGEYRVSSWWLFWSYILATLGELCLSPVGLSMVSKLAPARFATMLMGVWMLTSAFGNFAAGAAGELWGTVTPIAFFLWLSVIVAGSALVLLLLVRLLVKTMHGVK
jgi:POT family proton-dependent oligopeptide transporter